MDVERMIQNLLKYREEDDSFLDETNFGERQVTFFSSWVSLTVLIELS